MPRKAPTITALLLATTTALPAPPPENPIPLTLPTTALDTRTGEFIATYPVPPAPVTFPITHALYLRAGSPVQSRPELLSRTRAADDRIAEHANRRPTSLPSATTPWPLHYYVPATYHPGQLYGLLVYVSPSSRSTLPQPYEQLCDQHRLIAVAPELAGNDRYALWRIDLALESVLHSRQHFTLDPDRTYVAGMSGGARIASQVAIQFPDVFTGAVPMCGTDFYRNTSPPDTPDKYYPGFWRNPNQALLDVARRNSRLALYTATNDMNRAPTQVAFDAFHAENFAHVAYFEADGRGHSPAPLDYFDKCLTYLDSAYPTPEDLLTQANAPKQQPGQTYLLTARAAALSTDAALTTRATESAQSLFQTYTQESTHLPPTAPARRTFQTRWSPFQLPPTPATRPMR